MNIPATYQDINLVTSVKSPSTVHCRNTALSNYYMRQLFQRATSVFEIDAPDWWDHDYTVYNTFARGFVVVFNTDKFGVIPQYCDLSGFNVFYRPTTPIVANPLLKSNINLTLGQNCELIRLSPDYRGIIDTVSYYADQLALAGEALAVNLVNSKSSVIFSAGNKQTAESLKKMYDQIMAGNPMTVIDSSLLKADGSESWKPFISSSRDMYIAEEIISSMRSIENQFDTWVGLPNANYQKRERMISDEVQANRAETYSNASVWFDCLRDSFERVNKMFGLNCSVKWRFREEGDNGDTVSQGAV